MIQKVSMNLPEDKIEFLDRFGEYSSRTDTLIQDLNYYIWILREGMNSIYTQLSYNELKVLLGAFNGYLRSSSISPGMIIANIVDYDLYNSELTMNCENLEIDKRELLTKVKGFTAAEVYALMETAMRFWNTRISDMDEALKKIGVEEKHFRPYCS